MNERIFIIDDDPDLIRIATKLLEEAGYVVRSASDGKIGVSQIKKDPPQALFLDLQMPGMSGYDVCRALKADPQTRQVPIIFLSAQHEESNVVVGLELGADDYIAKPFRKNELLARLQSTLRRQSPITGSVIEVGPIKIDFSSYKVWIDEKPIKLTPKEFEVLGVFIKREGQVVTRASLSEQVWGANIASSSRTVDMTVERVRKRLGTYGSAIVGLRGIGYRFEL